MPRPQQWSRQVLVKFLRDFAMFMAEDRMIKTGEMETHMEMLRQSAEMLYGDA